MNPKVNKLIDKLLIIGKVRRTSRVPFVLFYMAVFFLVFFGIALITSAFHVYFDPFALFLLSLIIVLFPLGLTALLTLVAWSLAQFKRHQWGNSLREGPDSERTRVY